MSEIVHGGRLDTAIAQYGGEPDNWLDLSTGINPRSYPLPALDDVVWKRLPGEQAELALYQTARNYYRVSDRSGVVGANGTQAIIQVLPHILDRKSVSIVSPTYGEHFHCWKGVGGDVVEASTLNEAVSSGGVVVVGNPNNPDCRSYQPDVLVEAASVLAKSKGILMVDEAFCDVEPELSVVPQLPENVIVLRSFGKFFGLAGMRLGFAICNADLASRIFRMVGPWAVSGPALEIGRIAMSDVDWISNACKWVKEASQQQQEVLDRSGMEITGNAGLFLEAKHPNTAYICEQLMRVHVLVRPFEVRPDRLRFGLCADENSLARLETELTRVIGEL